MQVSRILLLCLFSIPVMILLRDSFYIIFYLNPRLYEHLVFTLQFIFSSTGCHASERSLDRLSICEPPVLDPSHDITLSLLAIE